MEEKDYKKLYEDVLERAKNGLKDKNYYLSQSAKEVTEFLFPQLKETEDEKVKRELTRFLINFNNGYYSKPSETEIDSWIKWMKKQGEQKSQGKSALDVWKDMRFEVYQQASGNRHEPNYSDDSTKMFSLTDIDEIFEKIAEKQGEQKPADNVNTYCQENCKGYRDTGGKCFADGECEAKKKAEQKTTWDKEDERILNKIQDHLREFYVDKKGYPYVAEPDSPEMKENNWLKSIKDRVQPQPKQDWSKDDETGWTNTMIMIKEVASHHYTKDSIKLVVDWLESIKNRIQPKQEWSKEDSERLLRIHQFIWANRKGDTDEIYQQEQDADWIMSIIPQSNQYDKGYNDGYSAAKYNQWKPTDKQMEDFRMLLDYNIGVFDYAKFMSADSLYEDLKKNLID